MCEKGCRGTWVRRMRKLINSVIKQTIGCADSISQNLRTKPLPFHRNSFKSHWKKWCACKLLVGNSPPRSVVGGKKRGFLDGSRQLAKPRSLVHLIWRVIGKAASKKKTQTWSGDHEKTHRDPGGLRWNRLPIYLSWKKTSDFLLGGLDTTVHIKRRKL